MFTYIPYNSHFMFWIGNKMYSSWVISRKTNMPIEKFFVSKWGRKFSSII